MLRLQTILCQQPLQGSRHRRSRKISPVNKEMWNCTHCFFHCVKVRTHFRIDRWFWMENADKNRQSSRTLARRLGFFKALSLSALTSWISSIIWRLFSALQRVQVSGFLKSAVKNIESFRCRISCKVLWRTSIEVAGHTLFPSSDHFWMEVYSCEITGSLIITGSKDINKMEYYKIMVNRIYMFFFVGVRSLTFKQRIPYRVGNTFIIC